MKKLLLTLCFLNFVFIFAQEKLIVEYESTMEMDMSKGFMITTRDNGNSTSTTIGSNKDMEKMVKEAMNEPTNYTLTLTQNESDFRMVEKLKNEQPSEGLVVKISAGNGITYKNLTENVSLKATSGFNQDFLIKDSLRKYDWKITRESKEILGYEVRKAEAAVDSTTQRPAGFVKFAGAICRRYESAANFTNP